MRQPKFTMKGIRLQVLLMILMTGLSIRLSAQFLGGSGDGQGLATLANADPCAYFFGDEGDGHAVLTLANPDTCGYYDGSEADGFDVITVAPAVPCPTFYGSTEDGFAVAGSNCFLLPITASDLSGRLKNRAGYLWWHTYSETNNVGFSLQRSHDQLDWQEIAFMPGIERSEATREYAHTDLEIKEGVNYYRWVQTDFDGASMTSNTVTLVLQDAAARSLMIWPNPVSNGASLQILYHSDHAGAVELAVFDLMGRQVLNMKGELDDQRLETALKVEHWVAGAYYLRILDQGRIATHRFIVH